MTECTHYKVVTEFKGLCFSCVVYNSSLLEWCECIEYKVGEFVECPPDRPMMVFDNLSDATIFRGDCYSRTIFECEIVPYKDDAIFMSPYAYALSTIAYIIQQKITNYDKPPKGTVFASAVKLVKKL